MVKVSELTEEIAVEMRKADNKALRVIADLNDMISVPLQGLIDKYRDEQKAGKNPPLPAEVLLGYIVYSMAQYENLHEGFVRPGSTMDSRELLHQLVEFGARSTLAVYMQQAGIAQKFRTDAEEYFATRGKPQQ